jgi:putative aldouronate transport system substrate-binding protein
MKMKRSMTLCIASALVLALLVGACKGKTAAATSGTQAKPLTYWMTLNGNVSAKFSNIGDTPFAKGLIERTGVQVEFLHPASGAATEQFNLIIADGNLPDLMEWNWLNTYPSGPEKAIADGVIIPLNEVFEKYCPNLTAFLKAHPEYDKMIRTDSGTYYCFPMIRDDPRLLNSTGLFINKGWLDESGLPVPTTIDEWHTVLTTFKQKHGGAPLSFEFDFLFSYENPFMYAYDVMQGLYVGFDGKIHLGEVENGYRDFLALMAQWYKEGLLDPDIASLKFDNVGAKITSGTAGASQGYMGSRMGVWITSGRATNPSFSLVAAPMPVLRKGDTSNFSPITMPYNYGGGCVAITTDCTDIEYAAKLLDWGYSKEGQLYYNFGTEGESYTLVNGEPVYTDFVMKNPDGWPVAQALSAYTRSSYNGPFVQDVRYTLQYQALPEQKEALEVWAIAKSLDRVRPPITPTPEESREYATIMTDVNTYAKEMQLRIVLGTENISVWDTYVSTINRMGLPRALEIQNAALARYNNR